MLAAAGLVALTVPSRARCGVDRRRPGRSPASGCARAAAQPPRRASRAPTGSVSAAGWRPARIAAPGSSGRPRTSGPARPAVGMLPFGGSSSSRPRSSGWSARGRRSAAVRPAGRREDGSVQGGQSSDGRSAPRCRRGHGPGGMSLADDTRSGSRSAGPRSMVRDASRLACCPRYGTSGEPLRLRRTVAEIVRPHRHPPRLPRSVRITRCGGLAWHCRAVWYNDPAGWRRRPTADTAVARTDCDERSRAPPAAPRPGDRLGCAGRGLTGRTRRPWRRRRTRPTRRG